MPRQELVARGNSESEKISPRAPLLIHMVTAALIAALALSLGPLFRIAPDCDHSADSVAAGLAGIAQGVQILRVHDVAETRQALEVWRAIASQP